MMRNNEVDMVLQYMNSVRKDAKQKGDAGEGVAKTIILDYMKHAGGTLFHSFKYPYAKDRYGRVYPGNVFRNGPNDYYTIEKDSYNDEIDLLYITNYRIFVIEVKARAGNWRLEKDNWIYNGKQAEEKSPECQAEKHARHLYHYIYDYLPNKDMNYIVPILVFVDRATVSDARAPEFKNYVRVAIANNLKSVIKRENIPGNFMLDRQKLCEKLLSFGEGEKYVTNNLL